VGALLSVATEEAASRLSLFVGSESGFVDAIDFSTQAEALADPMVVEHFEAGTGGFPSLAPQLDAARWLAKAATLIAQIGLGDDDLRWLLEHGASHGMLTPAQFPTSRVEGASPLLDAWLDLHRFAAFAREHMSGLVDLRRVLDAAEPELRAELAVATGWEEPTLADADSSIVVVLAQRGLAVAELRTIDGLEQLGRAFELARRLGVTAARAATWALATPDTAIARDIQAAAKAQLPAQRWSSVVEPIRDALRERQRDALVAYVLAADPELTGAADLFGRLLVDVEVSACVQTSRIKQALASVQTFVQRVLLGHEPGVRLSSSAATEWRWMSRYRVWEANRKIFLWPENWLEPELRHDKTELFRQFEHELLGGELSAESAEAAVGSYLQGLDHVARLRVAGMYHERELGPADTVVVDRLHVFARNHVRPYRYFYRARIDDAYWTPWEEVPLKIEAESVIPVVLQRRLTLLWVTPQERSKSAEAAEPLKYHELRLSWSVRGHRGWGDVRTAIRTSNDMGIHYVAPYTDAAPDELKEFPEYWLRLIDGTELFFRAHRLESGELSVEPGFLSAEAGQFGFPATFRLANVDAEPRIVSWRANDRVRRPQHAISPNPAMWLPRPLAMNPRQQWYELDRAQYSATDFLEHGLQVPVRSAWSGELKFQRLFDPPHAYTLAASSQYEEFSSQSPMVYQDGHRSLLIVPRPPSLTLQALPWVELAGPALEALGGLSHAGKLPPVAPMGPSSGEGAQGVGWEPEDELASLPKAAPQTASALEAWERWTFQLSAFGHPVAGDLVDLVRRHGVEGLFRPPADGEWSSYQRQLVRTELSEFYGLARETSTASGSVIDLIDFSPGGAYSAYNWELFFHAPMLVALRMMEDNRFEEAQRWMHFVFDPTEGGAAPTPSRYWKIKPLFESTATSAAEQIEALQYDGDDAAKIAAREATKDQIDRWRRNPFLPHALAQLRTAAYQRWVVMRYLDNLLAWGDHLFRQRTMEANNEALQLYLLAAELLGARPEVLPKQEAVAMSYADVQGNFDEFSNFIAQAENAIPLLSLDTKQRSVSAKLAHATLDVPVVQATAKAKVFATLALGGDAKSLVSMLQQAYFGSSIEGSPSPYFCVPHNEELLRYWDRVDDRLFKLRNCLDIEGMAQTQSLFAPPLDPGVLARAAAAGVDLSTALSDIGAPLPHYRFSTMLGLAKELAAEVRGFGTALAEALRNADAEALVELRARQEAELLATLRQVREQRITEASEAVGVIERAVEAVEHRRAHYASLIEGDLNSYEHNQIVKLGEAKDRLREAGQSEAIAASLASIPQFSFGISAGGPSSSVSFGGQQLAAQHSESAALKRSSSSEFQTDASVSGLVAAHGRRATDWTLQAEQAEKDLARLQQELVVARARVEVAQRELSDHDVQTSNAQQVDEYLRGRYSSAELFRWLGSELSRSYFQAYQLAFEIAKQAQRCYQHELGTLQANFIEFGYWDNRRKGLLAGERLLHDLRRMETSYLANHRREYE
ncbi:MAG: hypothetical protein K0V04_38655, partial [Deltaproteobacteria bacterium]|nr:hypothetical protein [Deltaproteobacteria bacterium]